MAVYGASSDTVAHCHLRDLVAALIVSHVESSWSHWLWASTALKAWWSCSRNVGRVVLADLLCTPNLLPSRFSILCEASSGGPSSCPCHHRSSIHCIVPPSTSVSPCLGNLQQFRGSPGMNNPGTHHSLVATQQDKSRGTGV